MAGFLEELLELAPHTLVAESGFTDEYGSFIVSGQVLSIPCNIEGESRLVRNAQNREVVSSHTVFCLEFNDLSVDKHRFTLPAPFGPPRDKLEAIRVDPVSDENGTLYEVVALP